MTASARLLVGLFVLGPVGVILYKLSGLPGADSLRLIISLADVPPDIHQHLRHVLFIPLGAVLIVLLRVTLGIRVLGPFRSILLAIAFQATGIMLGLLFLILVVGVVVSVRPIFRAIRLPYFPRVSAVLSTVALVIIIVLAAGQALDTTVFQRVAYFPVVVLCLIGDSFARVIQKEGVLSALWRGAMTAIAAVLIAAISSSSELAATLIHYPELVVIELGLIIIISEYFGFRLLARLNPSPKIRGRKFPAGRVMEKSTEVSDPRSESEEVWRTRKT